jgi:hypothetical protein
MEIYVPSGDTDLPSGRLTHAGRYNVPEVDLLYLVGRDTGLFDGMLDGSRTELRSGERREGSTERSNGCSGGREDVDWVFLERLGRLLPLAQIPHEIARQSRYAHHSSCTICDEWVSLSCFCSGVK